MADQDTASPQSPADPRVVILVDVENLPGWLAKGGADRLVEIAVQYGNPLTRRAYGDWTRENIRKTQRPLTKAGFRLVHTFHPVKRKDSADISLIVDAMRIAGRIPTDSWFVIVSGDSDFSPLFRALRDMGFGVVGVGRNSVLSEMVKSSCTRYVFVGDEPGKDHQALETIAQRKATGREDAFELARRVLDMESARLNIDVLRHKMITIDTSFDEKSIGFDRFLDFAKAVPGTAAALLGSVWFVWLEGLQETDTASSMAEPPEPPDLKAMYRRILNRFKWKPAPRAVVLAVYACLNVLHEQRSRSSLLELLEDQLGEHSTGTELRRAFQVLYRSRVVFVATREDGERGLYDCHRDMAVLAIEDHHDVAMARQILSVCASEELTWQPDLAAIWFLGSADPERVKRVVEIARAQNNAAEAQAGDLPDDSNASPPTSSST
jgi:uncharacterized LabA/DUF88 family protein